MKLSMNRIVMGLAVLGFACIGASAFAGDGGKRQHTAEAKETKSSERELTAQEKREKLNEERREKGLRPLPEIPGTPSSQVGVDSTERRRLRQEKRQSQRRAQAQQRIKKLPRGGIDGPALHDDGQGKVVPDVSESVE